MKCLQCGKEQLIPKNRWNSFKCCSRSCLFQWRSIHDQSKVTCKICQKEFSVIRTRKDIARYCSRRCYYKAMHLKGSVQVKCRHCEKQFLAAPSQKRIYCSRRCINKSKAGIWKATYNTVRRRMIKSGQVLHCERCGFSEFPDILGIHHKDRNRHNNALSNLEVLCPNCHSIEHMKHIVI
jgi:hypothetical protein